MRVREDNRDMVLLASVALVCALIALAAAAFPAPSTVRSANQQAALADDTPVRVVGPPFVPNTNPRDHQ